MYNIEREQTIKSAITAISWPLPSFAHDAFAEKVWLEAQRLVMSQFPGCLTNGISIELTKDIVL